jgi:hypothetical protein
MTCCASSSRLSHPFRPYRAQQAWRDDVIVTEPAPLGDPVRALASAEGSRAIDVTLRLVESRAPGLSHWYALIESNVSRALPVAREGDAPTVVTLEFDDGSTTRAFLTLPQSQLEGIRFVMGPGEPPRPLGGTVAGVREPRRPSPASGAGSAADHPPAPR